MMNREERRAQLAAVMMEKLRWEGADTLHDGLRLNEDLRIDSIMIVQLIVYIETDMHVLVPEAEVDPRTFDTVGSLLDFIETLKPWTPEPEEVSIKVHCIVSCFSEVVKRRSRVDYRPFYLGVWDAEFDVTNNGAITYYQHSLSHETYMIWFERLFGPKVHEWYDRTKDREKQLSTLISLIETCPEHRYVVAQIDMSYMPERENKFQQKPFPHFLILSATEKEDEWFMLDPDFRWEGIVKKDQVIEAFRHNPFGGGFYIDALDIREPSDEKVEQLFEGSFNKQHNELTSQLKKLITSLAEAGEEGLCKLVETVKQLPVIAIRKISYEHALMYFNDRAGSSYYEEFDNWTDRIEELVQGYSNVQYRTIKLAMTGNLSLLTGIIQALDALDLLELSIKNEVHRKYIQWRQSLTKKAGAAL